MNMETQLHPPVDSKVEINRTQSKSSKTPIILAVVFGVLLIGAYNMGLFEESSAPVVEVLPPPLVPPETLPTDFDYRAYYNNYQDLQNAVNADPTVSGNEELKIEWLKNHYMTHGYKEGRVYK